MKRWELVMLTKHGDSLVVSKHWLKSGALVEKWLAEVRTTEGITYEIRRR